MISPTRDITERVLEITVALAETLLELKKRNRAAVDADHRYRLEKAKATLKSDEKTVDKREAAVEILTNELRKEAKFAAGLEASAQERLRNLREELHALTSLAWVHRSEMELAR